MLKEGQEPKSQSPLSLNQVKDGFLHTLAEIVLNLELKQCRFEMQLCFFLTMSPEEAQYRALGL